MRDGVDPYLHFARMAAVVGTGDSDAVQGLLKQAGEAAEGDDLAQRFNIVAALFAGPTLGLLGDERKTSWSYAFAGESSNLVRTGVRRRRRKGRVTS